MPCVAVTVVNNNSKILIISDHFHLYWMSFRSSEISLFIFQLQQTESVTLRNRRTLTRPGSDVCLKEAGGMSLYRSWKSSTYYYIIFIAAFCNTMHFSHTFTAKGIFLFPSSVTLIWWHLHPFQNQNKLFFCSQSKQKTDSTDNSNMTLTLTTQRPF